MNNPLISICIPTYKRVDGLKKLLDSIRVQTFKNFEILINDDSPDDSIWLVVEEYQKILPVDYQKNVLASRAVENGIKVMQRANAAWVKVMHDDDWFACETSLQKFADAAISGKSDFIFCASNKVILETNKVIPQDLSREDGIMLAESVYMLIDRNVIGHPSVAMHKNDLNIVYDANFNWVLDLDFYLRYILAHGGYHYINERLVNIGYSAAQESNKYMKNASVEIPEYFSLLTKYEPGLALKNQFVFHLLWRMISRYKITSIDKIRKLGFHGPLPEGTSRIIAVLKFIPHIILKQPKWRTTLMKSFSKKIAPGMKEIVL